MLIFCLKSTGKTQEKKRYNIPEKLKIYSSLDDVVKLYSSMGFVVIANSHLSRDSLLLLTLFS